MSKGQQTSHIQLLKDTKKLEALVVFVDEAKKILGKGLDKDLLARISHPLKKGDFKGTSGETSLLYIEGHSLTSRVLLVGLGKAAKFDANTYRKAAATAIAQLKKSNILNRIAVLVPPSGKVKTTEIVEALELGSILFQFNLPHYRTTLTEDQKKKAKSFGFGYVVGSAAELRAGKAGMERGGIIGRGVNWGRRLIMLSPEQLFPDALVKEVQKMVAESPLKSKIKAEYWGEAELKKHKFGGVLGVGRGSDRPSRFIKLEYKNGPKSQKPIVLVGKGVTFDSGGLSLKPPPAQETMKYDMGGSASVLGAFKIATDLKLKTNLVCLVPTVENMPSGKAIKPGDILTMGGGKTVEVLNTDAEGRLILSDALYYGSTHYKPRAMIDVATLTGACAMLLGSAAAGIFSTSDKLKNSLIKNADEVNENLYPLPDYDDFYAPLLKSDIADMKNIGSREAGATTAAIFLRNFVENKVPWAHLDIAGCGWYEAPRDFIGSRGASGVPIRALVQFIEKYK